MRRLIHAALLLLLLGQASAFGQEEKEEVDGGTSGPPAFVRVGDVNVEAARLLRSEVDAERAWGAYLAGRNGLKGQTEALIRILEDPSLGDSWEHTLVRQAALDALIRLDAKAPAEVLRALPQTFLDETVILMSAAPAENAPALLDLFAWRDGEGGSDAYWLAAGNLLVGTKAQGFAAQLLRRLKVEAYIVVKDTEEERDFGWGGGSGCGGPAYRKMPEGFPPVSFYGLTTDLQRGAVVVAPGRHPVYYLRSGTRGAPCSFNVPPDRDIIRVKYLAALLDTHEEELKLETRPTLVVVCKEARQCRRELARVRDEIRLAYTGVVGRLVEKSLLGGAGDAPDAPDITFTLVDERRHKTYPLPTSLRGVTVRIESWEADDAAEDAEP